MKTIVNKTFEEIIVGDTASVERTLQVGDVRAWAVAFGEAGTLTGPGESQEAAGIVTGILTALAWFSPSRTRDLDPLDFSADQERAADRRRDDGAARRAGEAFRSGNCRA